MVFFRSRAKKAVSVCRVKRTSYVAQLRTFGRLSSLATTRRPPATTLFSELSVMLRRVHGPYEAVTGMDTSRLIVRQWPSGERGSLRMTLDVDTDEIVILYDSGVAT